MYSCHISGGRRHPHLSMFTEQNRRTSFPPFSGVWESCQIFVVFCQSCVQVGDRQPRYSKLLADVSVLFRSPRGFRNHTGSTCPAPGLPHPAHPPSTLLLHSPPQVAAGIILEGSVESRHTQAPPFLSGRVTQVVHGGWALPDSDDWAPPTPPQPQGCRRPDSADLCMCVRCHRKT